MTMVQLGVNSGIGKLQFPQVAFLLDKELDVWKFNRFLFGSQNHGVDFKRIILRQHPQLKDIDFSEDKDERIRKYVNDYYSRNGTKLKEAVLTIKSSWGNYAPEFFAKLGGIFPDCSWPVGEYKGYLSISAPYPRFVDRKVFQLPCSQGVEWAIGVVAHEMTHFLFYEYVRKRFTPKLDNTSEGEMNKLLEGKFRIPLWELSEVFNLKVLIPSEFGHGGSDPSTSAYIGLEKYRVLFRELWEETKGNVDSLFSRLEKPVE